MFLNVFFFFFKAGEFLQSLLAAGRGHSDRATGGPTSILRITHTKLLSPLQHRAPGGVENPRADVHLVVLLGIQNNFEGVCTFN